MKSPRVTVLACGNPSRGDDAIGPLLAQRLEAWLPADSNVSLVCDYQFQVEHALELVDCDLALFVDCSEDVGNTCSFDRVSAAPDTIYTSHALSPAAVLRVFGLIEKQPPPPAFVLAIPARQFGLGADLTPFSEEKLEEAWRLVTHLLAAPDVAQWNAMATGNIAP